MKGIEPHKTAQDFHSAIASALAAPIRKPLLPEIETIVGRRNPRIWLACALGAATSNLLAWQIAKNTCSVFRAPDTGCSPSKEELLALRSAIRLVLAAFRSSPQDALQVSCGIAQLSGCRKDYLARFLDFLAPIAEANPGFASMLMSNFSANPRDSRLLGLYHGAISLSLEKGGEKAASTLSGLFREVGRFTESAGLLLENYIFSLRNMRIDEVERFTEKFCEDWKKTLESDVFRNNPPD